MATRSDYPRKQKSCQQFGTKVALDDFGTGYANDNVLLSLRPDYVKVDNYLAMMDEVYSHLVTIDFPDALTGGLRRSTDVLRGVLERTRGDMTVAVRQEELQAALSAFERKSGVGG